ncbi:hypothetical protein [Compostimonas suwonensis]|uniref:Uncharacterized protein n=1 Tax=Compostimonas suwonensis TaxID=1048394 RepID=A0A2M9BZV6_9MICO|nr:hypothetical protein [Compostimonas suwonensis]PJJ63618.1 hypothetical protein CLV54_1288 [Compostimonas suwonensis]
MVEVILRRAFFYWQSVAAFAIPAWWLVGWCVFSPGGWAFLLLLVCAFVLFVVMLVLFGLVYARREVRQTRAFSWPDVAVFAAWDAAMIALGFFTPVTTLFVVLTIIGAIAVFWVSLAQLLASASRRLLGDPAPAGPAPSVGYRSPAAPDLGGDTPIIVVEEKREEH